MGYKGVTLSPSWLTEAASTLLPNLVEISLWSCTCEHLGSLRKLPHLKILDLWNMYSLKFIEDDASAAAGGGGFPSLERLGLRNMSNLEGWSPSNSWWSWSQASAEEGFRWLIEGLSLEGSSSSSSSSQAPTPAVAVFPCLKSVRLYNCPKLKGGVPLAWSPVQDVDIHGSKCNGMVLGSLRDLPSLPSLRIDYFDDLEYFPSGTLTNLTALHYLEINHCHCLRALPVELYSLATLTELKIWNCPNLVSLAAEEREGGLKNLSSLKTFDIKRCKALKCLPELEKASLVTLKIRDCPQMEFSKEDFEHLVVLEELLLVGLPKLTCFPEGIKHSAATLRILRLVPRFHYGAADAEVDLPDWIGTTLTSLALLAIQAHKNWKVLPQWMKHLTARTDLTIYKCGELLEEWKASDMISHIPHAHLYRI